MRDMTFSDVERLGAAVGEADEAFSMDEDSFRVFYERTARPVWAYLSRMTGEPRLADDLLQEAYYRFLRAGSTHEKAHRATIVSHRDQSRARSPAQAAAERVEMTEGIDAVDARQDGRAGNVAGARRGASIARAMGRRPRERDMLWLAYANGSSHQEIADALGLKRASIKLLLFRARRRLANLLRDQET
jgi:RNA polymerase sigma-70 factor (ECF subfamily)